jgi:hypothetical protein
LLFNGAVNEPFVCSLFLLMTTVAAAVA